MSIALLPKSLQTSISSGQVIASVESVVKELIENAVDAQASSIEIRLFGSGLSEISVKDNGLGIPSEDCALMAARYTTSKHTSLAEISSYGFRGEALNSICAMSTKTIVSTRTSNDTNGRLYILDIEGVVVKQEQFTMQQGTMVSAFNLFQNLPVRKQCAIKNALKTNKNTLELIKRFSVIYPDIRFYHKYQKSGAKKDDAVFNKPSVATYMDAIGCIFSTHFAKECKQIEFTSTNASTEFITTLIYQQPSTSHLSVQMDTLLYINKRPITRLSKPVRALFESLRQALHLKFGIVKDRKSVFLMLVLDTDPAVLDVNVEPNKEAVGIHGEQEVCDGIQDKFNAYLETLVGSVIELVGIIVADEIKEDEADDRIAPQALDAVVPYSRADWSAGRVSGLKEPTSLANANTRPAAQLVKNPYHPYQPESQLTLTPAKKVECEPRQMPASLLHKAFTQKDLQYTPTTYESKVLSPNTSPRAPTAYENTRAVEAKYGDVTKKRKHTARIEIDDTTLQLDNEYRDTNGSEMNVFYRFIHASDSKVLNEIIQISPAIRKQPCKGDMYVGEVLVNALQISLYHTASSLIAVNMNSLCDPDEDTDTIKSIETIVLGVEVETDECVIHGNSVYTRIAL